MTSPIFDSLIHPENRISIKDSCNCNCCPFWKRPRKPLVDLPKLTDEEIYRIMTARFTQNPDYICTIRTPR